MLFLTNFLITACVMAVLVAYIFGVTALAGWAGDKWGNKGFNSVVSVLLLLPIAILAALGMTYGT